MIAKSKGASSAFIRSKKNSTSITAATSSCQILVARFCFFVHYQYRYYLGRLARSEIEIIMTD